MRFHWTLSSLPEMSTIPKSERRALWRDAQKRAGWSARFLLSILIPILCIIPSTYYVDDLAKACGFDKTGQLLFRLVTYMTGFYISFQFQIWALRPYLRQIIGTLCLTCGHDLRPSFTQCPQCGTIPANVIPPNTLSA